MSDEDVQIARCGVNPYYYLARYTDLPADTDAVQHYVHHGWREGRDPCAWFSTSAYLSEHVDVAAADVNPLVHYLHFGFREGRRVRRGASIQGELETSRSAEPTADDSPEEFEAAYYQQQIAALDLVVGNEGLWNHYLEKGALLGLDPAPWFHSLYYLETYPDVASAGLNPFLHYLWEGRREGRSTEPPPFSLASEEDRISIAAEFDAEYYLATSPDVEAAGVDPLEHFLAAGWREGRNPNPHFSTSDYLDLNPDVERSGLNPFLHYLAEGRAQGRAGKPNLGFRYSVLRTPKDLDERVESARLHARDFGISGSTTLRRALDCARNLSGRLVLTVSHDDFTANIGGVQLCLEREMLSFEQLTLNHVHLYPAVALPVTELSDRSPALGVLVNGKNIGVFAACDIMSAAAELGPRWSGAQVVFHSLLGHSADDLLKICAAFGIRKGLFWIHDYASVCAGYTLMRNDVEFCGAPPMTSLACNICVYGPGRPIQHSNHRRLFESLQLAAVAPSKSASDVWTAAEHPVEHLVVHEHCQLRPTKQKARTSRIGPLRIAFLGHPNLHKGWPVFEALAVAQQGDSRYAFVHLGQGPQRGLGIEFHPVRVGRGAEAAMSDAINEHLVDVALLWSLWPETFCFTAYEAYAGGAAVLTCPSSGNVARFVEAKKDRGLVIPSEARLMELFQTGEVIKLARARRRPNLHLIQYSGMSADILEVAK